MSGRLIVTVEIAQDQAGEPKADWAAAAGFLQERLTDGFHAGTTARAVSMSVVVVAELSLPFAQEPDAEHVGYNIELRLPEGLGPRTSVRVVSAVWKEDE